MHLPTPSDVSRRTFGLTALGLVAAAAVPALRRNEDGTAAAVGEQAALSRTPRPEGAPVDRASAGAGVSTDGPAPPAPDVVSRRAWDPDGTCTIEKGAATRPMRIHLHHTHEPVVARPDEVPRALQSICRSHIERGFGGIGYHYAVDPFGRVWQGRGPLPPKLPERVRNGAHAQGFNDNSLGVVLVGDFEEAPPATDAMIALEALLAHLVWRYDIDPLATVRARSTGGSATRYAQGQRVDLPAVCGHRDTGAGTACPGQALYARLPQVRAGVVRRLELAAAG